MAFCLFANKKINTKEGYSLKFQLPKTFPTLWVHDVSALNLSLAGGKIHE